MILSWILGFLISGCKEAEVEENRSKFSNDLPKTGREVAQFARRAVGSEQKWIDPIRPNSKGHNYGPVSLFEPRPRQGEIFLSTAPYFKESQANVTISSPFISEYGVLRATITNNSVKEIQIYPSACGVEILFGDRIGTLIATDPGFVSFVSTDIPPGKAEEFSFNLIPGVTDLSGKLRLLVHALTTNPLESKTVKSDPFEISALKSKTKSKPGANKGRQATASPPPAP